MHLVWKTPSFSPWRVLLLACKTLAKSEFLSSLWFHFYFLFPLSEITSLAACTKGCFSLPCTHVSIIRYYREIAAAKWDNASMQLILMFQYEIMLIYRLICITYFKQLFGTLTFLREVVKMPNTMMYLLSLGWKSSKTFNYDTRNILTFFCGKMICWFYLINRHAIKGNKR